MGKTVAALKIFANFFVTNSEAPRSEFETRKLNYELNLKRLGDLLKSIRSRFSHIPPREKFTNVLRHGAFQESLSSSKHRKKTAWDLTATVNIIHYVVVFVWESTAGS